MSATLRKVRPYALEHALAYVAQSWPVLPLAPGGKRPAGELVPHGFKNATTDPETVRRWFASTPGAGVGIVPGPAMLLVLDVDDKHGEDGRATLANLEAMHGELPATLTQRTPNGGGFHLFFGLTDEGAIGNRKLGVGIDVRCAEGYVAAEPTVIRREDGTEGRYSFDDWDITAGEAPEIAQAPEWLLELLSIGGQAAPGEHAAPAEPEARAVVPPQTITELRSALNALDPDDYHVWVNAGIALSTLGNAGRELWLTWSQQSAKFNPAEAAKKWRTFKAEATGYAGVFKAAQAAGWVNPASREAGALATAAAPQRAPWRDVEVCDLDAAVLAPQRWVWEGRIPAGELTLLGAHGGTGKSYVALMLAVSVALGLPLFEVATEPRPVLFYSAEDGADTVRRRLQTILRGMDVSAALLRGRLRILDASQGPAELFGMTFNDEGLPRLGATKAADALRQELTGAAGALLIVDNASDTFGGNEIARVEVRQFVRLLVGMVRDSGGAVCLLAHVDKNTANGLGGSQSYSGSTAWNNSARSRLAMSRDKDGTLLIQQQKSNHGPASPDLRLVWPRDGLPQLDAPTSGVVLAIATDNATRALLRLVHEFTQRGEFISAATTSRTHAGKLLRGQPGFPQRMTDGEVFDLLRRAERRGWLARVNYKGSDRKERARLEVTPAGAAACEIEGFAATAATSRDSESHRTGASPAEPAATAATSPPGGVGGGARAVAAEVPAP